MAACRLVELRRGGDAGDGAEGITPSPQLCYGASRLASLSSPTKGEEAGWHARRISCPFGLHPEVEVLRDGVLAQALGKFGGRWGPAEGLVKATFLQGAPELVEQHLALADGGEMTLEQLFEQVEVALLRRDTATGEVKRVE